MSGHWGVFSMSLFWLHTFRHLNEHDRYEAIKCKSKFKVVGMCDHLIVDVIEQCLGRVITDRPTVLDLLEHEYLVGKNIVTSPPQPSLTTHQINSKMQCQEYGETNCQQATDAEIVTQSGIIHDNESNPVTKKLKTPINAKQRSNKAICCKMQKKRQVNTMGTRSLEKEGGRYRAISKD